MGRALRSLAAVSVILLATPLALAQEASAQAPALREGPMTAWCAPGQALLSGGYTLADAQPPATESGLPAVFVAASHPTSWRDGNGAIAQVGWTAVPNTLAGAAGPLTAYALCTGEATTTVPSTQIPPPPVLPTPPRPATTEDTMTAPEVVATVGPAVVTVLTEQFDEDGVTLRPTRSGSGFFLDHGGHLITNAHVVTDGVAFVVILADGRRIPATLVGADAVSDIAVLHVETPVPAAVRLGDAEALRPGQTVLALGSPLGTYTNTVTQGIVSALDRTVPERAGRPALGHLIQHDAAINPGSSGGPLVTLTGEVVGINTLGVLDAQGLFFAVPAATISHVASSLIARRPITYPDLGLDLLDLDEVTIQQWALPVLDGWYVLAVMPNGPAAAAGLQSGDIVTAINLERVGNRRSLTGVLFTHQPGETVQLTVQRGRVTLRVPVVLTTRPPDP